VEPLRHILAGLAGDISLLLQMATGTPAIERWETPILSSEAMTALTERPDATSCSNVTLMHKWIAQHAGPVIYVRGGATKRRRRGPLNHVIL